MSMILQIFWAWRSDSEPPKTVKSWRKHEDQPAVDRARSGDDAVARDLLRLHAEIDAIMLDVHVELLERMRIEQDVQPLARRQPALLVLRLDTRRATARPRRRPPPFQFFKGLEHRFPRMRCGRLSSASGEVNPPIFPPPAGGRAPQRGRVGLRLPTGPPPAALARVALPAGEGVKAISKTPPPPPDRPAARAARPRPAGPCPIALPATARRDAPPSRRPQHPAGPRPPPGR